MPCVGSGKMTSRDGIGKRNQGKREEEKKKGEEKKIAFFLAKGYFPWVLRLEEIPDGQGASCLGDKETDLITQLNWR